MAIVSRIRELRDLTQSDLAALAGTSQPAIAAYESGAKVPSVRTLRRLASSVGLELDISITTPLTREDHRSLYLHRVIARKLVADPTSVVCRARQNLAAMRKLHPSADDLLGDWQALLGSSIPLLTEVMTSKSPRARELRQVTPFAGVLTASERADVYREFRQRGRE